MRSGAWPLSLCGVQACCVVLWVLEGSAHLLTTQTCLIVVPILSPSLPRSSDHPFRYS